MPNSPNSKTWNSPVGPAPMMTASASIGFEVTVMQKPVEQIIGELVGNLRRVMMAARGIPFGNPVQRPEDREHGNLAVQPGLEAAIGDSLIDELHEKLLIATPLVECTRQVRLGHEPPLMKNHQGAARVFGRDPDMRLDRDAQTFDDGPGGRHLRLDREE